MSKKNKLFIPFGTKIEQDPNSGLLTYSGSAPQWVIFDEEEANRLANEKTIKELMGAPLPEEPELELTSYGTFTLKDLYPGNKIIISSIGDK